MPPMQREPCFWLTTNESNGKFERERTLIVNGRRVTEKHPQIGHEGDYENKRRARGIRYIMVIRHEGHMVPLLLTNAAAHLDPNTGYGNYQRRKARFLGWYAAGGCPVAQLATGDLRPESIVSDEVRSASSCPPNSCSLKQPCVHDLAERKARMELWNADQKERLAGFRTEAEKHMEDLRKANKENMVDLAAIIAEQMAAQAAALAPSRKQKDEAK